MKKLTLKLDDLQVESFNTGRPALRGGTVQAHADMSANAAPGSPCGLPEAQADAVAPMISTQDSTPEDSFGTICFVCY